VPERVLVSPSRRTRETLEAVLGVLGYVEQRPDRRIYEATPGTLMQVRDFKKTTSGFIHGFRYNVRSLFNMLEQNYYQLPWPSRTIEPTAEALVAEIDASYEAAGDLADPQDAFDRNVAPLIAVLAELAMDQPAPPNFLPFLNRALELARDNMRRNLAARARQLSNSVAKHLPRTLQDGLDLFRRLWQRPV